MKLSITPTHELDLIKLAAPFLEHMPEKERNLLLQRVSLAALAIPPWPTYTGISKLVGYSASRKLTVYVDPTLDPQVEVNARYLISNGDSIATKNDAIFGTAGGPVNVIIYALGGMKNGQGGADHKTCNYTEGQHIEIDYDDGSPIFSSSGQGIVPRPDPLARTIALFEAELSECSMQNFLCGQSTGEALSRWCAYQVVGNVLPDFATAPIWLTFLATNLFNLDYVDTEVASDTSLKGNGCGVVFLSWLQSKNMGGLGIPLSVIAPKMVALGNTGTFAQLYAQLTGKPASAAWPDFQAAMVAAGGLIKLSQSPFGDDVFNALNHAF